MKGCIKILQDVQEAKQCNKHKDLITLAFNEVLIHKKDFVNLTSSTVIFSQNDNSNFINEISTIWLFIVLVTILNHEMKDERVEWTPTTTTLASFAVTRNACTNWCAASLHLIRTSSKKVQGRYLFYIF